MFDVMYSKRSAAAVRRDMRCPSKNDQDWWELGGWQSAGCGFEGFEGSAVPDLPCPTDSLHDLFVVGVVQRLRLRPSDRSP